MNKQLYYLFVIGLVLSCKPKETVVPDLETVIAVGRRHGLVVKPDHTLWAFGDNFRGALSNVVAISGQNKPIQIMSDVKATVAGDFFSIVLKTDNSLWTMGYNSVGQLGHSWNKEVESFIPTIRVFS